MERSKAAALKAIELNDSLSSAHVNLGVVKLEYDWHWNAAEREFKRAIQLNAKDPAGHRLYGWLLISTGRFQEAQVEMKHALDAEPLNGFYLMEMGLSHYFARDYVGSIEQAHRAIGVDPSFYWSHLLLGWAREQLGEFSPALEELNDADRLSLGETPQITASLGHAFAISGNRSEAQKSIAALEQRSKHSYVSLYDFAVIYAGLGDKKNALIWLDKAYDDRCGWLALWLKVDPKFDSLRSDSQFQDLLKRIGFAS